MASLREWIQACRIHTASLTIAGCLLGALLAYHELHAEPDWRMLLPLAAWAVIFHGPSGFLMNNILDLDYDRVDPGKREFPLVTGAITLQTAKRAFFASLIIMLTLGALLVRGSLPDSMPAFIALASATFFGILYNITSKRSFLGPIWISLSFASIPAFGYLATGGPPLNPSLLYVSLYGFFILLWEVGVAGFTKDLGSDPRVSWLRYLSSNATPIDTEPGLYRYHFTNGTNALSMTLAVICPFLAAQYMASTYLVPPFSILAITVILLSALRLFFAQHTVTSGVYKRKHKILSMSLSEIFVYFILVASLEPALGVTLTLAFTLFPLVWFIFWNRFMWGAGHWLNPKV